MSNLQLSGLDLCGVFEAMAHDMKAHLEELRDLDAALGDGDLGITMELASAVLGDAKDAGPADDVGALLVGLGLRINKASPSTFGTLLASAFISAGAAVRGKPAVGAEDLTTMGSAAIEGIKRRGKAEVGDKTMLDSLVPAVEAYEDELNKGAELAQALQAAVAASERGMLATSAMTARHGRGSWRREESVGVRDGGATALHYLIQSFADRVAAYGGSGTA